LEEAVYLGITKNFTPEIFREAAINVKEKKLTIEQAKIFVYYKQNHLNDHNIYWNDIL
jgi:hypothetical protein